MEGSKSLQRCVNDDNDIKGSLTCISLLIINIHHPSAYMHSVRASVNVPQSCRNCSFRAHISAAISSRSYLARLAFMGTSHTFRVVRVFTSVKTWEPMRFQYLLFTNLVKSNIECISNIPLQFNVRFPSGLLLCEEIQLATWNYLNVGPVESASNKICLPCFAKGVITIVQLFNSLVKNQHSKGI